MIGIVILVIIALSAILVYLDASAHRIGDISDHKSNFNKSAMYWAVGTLFLWPYTLPYYLRMRRRLIEAAAEHPIEEHRRLFKASAVTLVAAGYIIASVALPGAPNEIDLPSCNSPETLIKLSRILDASSVSTMTDNDITRISGTKEIDHLTDSIIRVCSGSLTTPKGESPVRYIVRWDDASRQEFQVAMQSVAL